MVRRPLWIPSEEHVKEANLTHFISLVNRKYSIGIQSYKELYRWSIEKVPDFWSAIWNYAGIISSRSYAKVVDDLAKFPGSSWFPGARLNFAENLLRFRDERTAFVARSEAGVTSKLAYSDLYRRVGRLAGWLRKGGVCPGDRVAGYMPNVVETAIAMLAATSVGAVWACCGAELGPNAVLDRLGQVKPKVLIAADGYLYKGREFEILPSVAKVVDGVPSIAKVVVVSNLGRDVGIEQLRGSVMFDELVGSGRDGEVKFEQLPADHPVYVMFTSGTTGKPKCMVQGAAGVLVNQLKEVLLHADLKKTDRVTYITSPSWMMWNWLMSCLSVGSSIILYDGSPNHPAWGAMWSLGGYVESSRAGEDILLGL